MSKSKNSTGRAIDTLTATAGYKQIINKPTHVINNPSSCIDLIFCNNQMYSQNMELIFPSLTNAPTISCMVGFIFAYPCHQYMSVKSRITVRQVLKMLRKQHQKQPSRGALRKRCSENIQQIYRKHPCRSAISIKLLCNFIEITLRHGCSPVSLLHIFRTLFPKNTPGRLLVQD